MRFFKIIALFCFGVFLALQSLAAAVVYIFDQGFSIGEEVGNVSFTMQGDSEIAIGFQLSNRWTMIGVSPSNEIQAVGNNTFASRIEFGEELGSDLDWFSARARTPAVLADPQGSGSFFDTEGFLGVRMFVDDPLPHYGWVRISQSADDSLLTVHDWAWNSTPGEPILAGEIPEPATYAAIIGAGALLVVFLRRRYFSRSEPRRRGGERE